MHTHGGIGRHFEGNRDFRGILAVVRHVGRQRGFGRETRPDLRRPRQITTANLDRQCLPGNDGLR